MPDAEKVSEVTVKEEYFFHTTTYRRIETVQMEYMRSSETLEIRDVHKTIKWHRVIGAVVMCMGLLVLYLVFTQRNSETSLVLITSPYAYIASRDPSSFFSIASTFV